MNIEYTELDRQNTDSIKEVTRWKKAKRDLDKRADELKTEADRIRSKNPAGAAVLMERRNKLIADSNRMATEAKKGISGKRIAIFATLAEISLQIDRLKGK